METITMRDIEKARKTVQENSKCTCNKEHAFICFKHGIIGFGKINTEELKKFMEEIKNGQRKICNGS